MTDKECGISAMPTLSRLAKSLVSGLGDSDSYCTNCMRVSDKLVLMFLIIKCGADVVKIKSYTTIFTELHALRWDAIRKHREPRGNPDACCHNWCDAWNNTFVELRLGVPYLDWYPAPCSWCVLTDAKTMRRQLHAHVKFWKAFFVVMEEHDDSAPADDVKDIQARMKRLV